MVSRIRHAGLGVGLAVMAAVMLGHTAQAGAIIISSGGTAPVGDPLYNYYFDVELTANSTLQTGGYFTVYDLPGVVAGSLTGEPNSNWGYSIQELGKNPTNTPVSVVNGDGPTIENVTWVYHGPATTAGSSALDLGTFVIQTENLATQPTPTLVYVGSLDGTNYSNSGTIQVNAIVPEPASIVLLASGCLLAPVLIARSRRKHDHAADAPA